MTTRYQAFFDGYVKAINEQDFAALKSCFKLPFILVHQEPRSVVSFDQELERKVKSFLLNLKEQGIQELRASIRKVFNMPTDMAFVTVDWQFICMDGKEHSQYTNSYILSEQQQKPEIITLIVDDKHDFFSQLLR